MYMSQLRNSLIEGLEHLANIALSKGNDHKVSDMLRLMLDLTGNGTALGDTFFLNLSRLMPRLEDTLSSTDWYYLSNRHGISKDKLLRVSV